MQVDAANKALCSVTDAAGILQVDRATVLRWIRQGKLRAVGKLSGETGSFVLDREAVQQVADERTENSLRTEQQAAENAQRAAS